MSTIIATVAAFVATIVRPSPRGDWVATVPVAAFDAVAADGTTTNDAAGSFVAVAADTATVRFGGRAGPMIVNAPNDGTRAAFVVASVRAMRDTMADGTYHNDARPGAIPSPVVAVAIGIARDIRDGARVRRTFGTIPASRRVAATRPIAARAAKTFGTTDPYAPPADTRAPYDAATVARAFRANRDRDRRAARAARA